MSDPDDRRPLPRDGGSPVFLERRTYRRRRMADAARLLPILGALLLVIPLLWQGNAEAPTRTTDVMLYIFGVWAVLTGLSALVSRDLWQGSGTAEEADDAADRDESARTYGAGQGEGR